MSAELHSYLANQVSPVVKVLSSAETVEKAVNEITVANEKNRADYQQGVKDQKNGLEWSKDKSAAWSSGYLDSLEGEE